jgi:DNA-binding CsgD family transcriptional regulator
MGRKLTDLSESSELSATDRLSRLSPREQEIAACYASAKTSREIAGMLCISQTTVRNHVATVYRKLGIGNKTELVNLLVDSKSDSGSRSDLSRASLETQLRAINDTLRVISHSPGDLDAIFDVILDYALTLSDSQFGGVYAYLDNAFEAVCLKNVPVAFQQYLQSGKIYPGPKTGLGRMQRQHRIIHISDVRSEDLYRSGDPLRLATADLGGARSFVAIPMIHRDNLVGAFTIYRQEIRPFSDHELSLLKAFSDQAAIALTITSLIDDRSRLIEKLEQQQKTIETLNRPLESG